MTARPITTACPEGQVPRDVFDDVDPDSGVGYGYVTSQMGTSLTGDPRDVARIVELSRATYRKMVQNLWWAAGYNIVAIPLAAGVLAPWGITMPPAVGGTSISTSHSFKRVTFNAALGWWRERGHRPHRSFEDARALVSLAAAVALSIGLAHP